MAAETVEGVPPPLNLATEPSIGASGRWLTVLWPLAILLHLAGNGGHLLALQAAPSFIGIVQLAIVAAAAVSLIRPGPRAAGVLAALFVLVLWLKMPVVGNHEIILGLFSLAVIPAVFAGGRNWPETVAPAGRLVLLVSYGFIAFSKLNTGFLDTVESCAVLFADEFGGVVGVRPGRSAVASGLVIAGTVAIEASIPVLLLIGRFRRYGVGLALGFHFVLALDPASHIWDFSATLLPLFLLFSPSGFRDAIDRRLKSFDRRPWSESALMIALVLAIQAVVMAGGLPGVPTWGLAFPIWLFVSAAVTAGYWLSLTMAEGPTPSAEQPQRPVETRAAVGSPMFALAGPNWLKASMVVIVGVAMLNGIAPYLELRSAAAFNMYSNLRVVDGRSNHLIVGGIRSGDESTYVTLVGVDDRSVLEFYIERDLAVPSENLDRFLMAHPNENPSILDAGQPILARNVGYGVVDEDIGWVQRLRSTFARKLGARRAVHSQSGKPAGVGTESGVEDRCLRAWGPIG